MNKVDYDKKMQEIIKGHNGEKKSLLLHSCCAPCSTACIERLKDYFNITIFYYNPNIEDDEYYQRKSEQIRFLNETGWANYIDCDHESEVFYKAICGLENEREGGKRCEVCYRIRINKTAQKARELGFNYFTTTLTISPMKSSKTLNEIGESEEMDGVKWLYTDFKKRNGYLRSCVLAKEYNLYRQNYCGCEYSRKEAENREKKGDENE